MGHRAAVEGMEVKNVRSKILAARRIVELSKFRGTTQESIVIPNAVRNLLFLHEEADSSGVALGMTFSNQDVTHYERLNNCLADATQVNQKSPKVRANACSAGSLPLCATGC